jgi:single-strand DNA-binding protein
LVKRETDPELSFSGDIILKRSENGSVLTNVPQQIETHSPSVFEWGYIPVIYWENSGETCGNNLIKGRRVLTEGRLQIRDTEKIDKKRRSTDVVRLELRFF